MIFISADLNLVFVDLKGTQNKSTLIISLMKT